MSKGMSRKQAATLTPAEKQLRVESLLAWLERHAPVIVDGTATRNELLEAADVARDLGRALSDLRDVTT